MNFSAEISIVSVEHCYFVPGDNHPFGQRLVAADRKRSDSAEEIASRAELLSKTATAWSKITCYQNFIKENI